MNIGSGEAAVQMVRMMLTGGEVTLKLGASALKNVAAMSAALARSHKKLYGKVQMRRMLRETRDLRLFPMSPDELKAFQREAKRQRVLYSTIVDKRTGQIDVVIPSTDLERANRAFDRTMLHGAQAKEPEQERPPKKGRRSGRDSSEISERSSSSRSRDESWTTTEGRTSVDARLRAYREYLNRRKSDPAKEKAKVKTPLKSR